MVVTIGLNWQQELYVYLNIYIYTVHICRYDHICMLTQAGWNHRHMFVSGYLLPPFRKLSNLSLHATVQQSLTRRKEDISWSFDVSLILKLWRKQCAVVTPEGFELLLRYKIRLQLSMAHISAASLRFWRTKCTSWVCFGSDWLQTWPSVNNQRRRFVSGCVCVCFFLR